MIIVRLKGGMGNQMFQYAFGAQVARLLQTDLQLDVSVLMDRSKEGIVHRDFDLSIFNIKNKFTVNPTLLNTIYKLKLSFITQLVKKQVNRGRHYIKESHFHFQPDLISNPRDGTIYEGWFQSPKYFAGMEAILREVFTFRQPIMERSQALLQRIQSSHSICLNVRRTDFLKVDNLNTTDKYYFLNAAECLAKRIENPNFYIFSDDIEWCRKNLNLAYPTEIVDHTHKGVKFGNYMQLMIACKHFIIPNSSFAWWAVWLNKNKSKHVIAPKVWFRDSTIDTSDLVPAEWERK